MVQYLKMKKHEATVLLINPQNPHVLVRFISTDGASCACSFRLFVISVTTVHIDCTGDLMKLPLRHHKDIIPVFRSCRLSFVLT